MNWSENQTGLEPEFTHLLSMLPFLPHRDINHNHKTLLLSIFMGLGISGIAWHWFSSYLEGHIRWQGGSTSSPHKLSTGVTQGSVLGPLLFFLSHWGHILEWVLISLSAMQMTFNLSFPFPTQTLMCPLRSQHQAFVIALDNAHLRSLHATLG